MHAVAYSWFREQYTASWVPAYVTARGIPSALAARWGIGHAPKTGLATLLRGLGFADDRIVTAGLARRPTPPTPSGQTQPHSAASVTPCGPAEPYGAGPSEAYGRAGRYGASPVEASGPGPVEAYRRKDGRDGPRNGAARGGRPEAGRRVLYDTFRDRCVLPLRDAGGEVVGFVGRRRPGGGGPKYLNSPASPLFDKGSVLFGLFENRALLAAGARPVLVEGPFDVLALARSGMPAVSACGTRVTARQLDLLRAYAALDRAGLLVAFDADAAGRAALVRAWPLLSSAVAGPLDALDLPPGTDPASAEFLGTRPLADLLVDARLGAAPPFLPYRLAAVAPLIAALPPPQVPRQVARVAAALPLPHHHVTAAVLAAIH